MMTTEEWNDKPRGKEYGAEPEFDANGWCHDMSAAPRDGSWVLVTANSWQGDMMVVGWHFGCWRDNQDPDAPEYTPTAWRPLPLSPVEEQDQ